MNVVATSDKFRKVFYEDALVNRAVSAGASYEEIIVAMAERHNELVERMVQLRSIAPFRINVDGKAMIWRCPDNLVPEQEVAQ